MEKLTIVKVGGAVVEDPQKLALLLGEFAQIDGRKLLVHGGGRSATSMATSMGLETRMVEGRRITDADMLRVVVMVYAGLVNKSIVAQLQARGVNAVGLTGADADVVRSHRRQLVNGVDYGFVGDVDKVNAAALSNLIEQGIVPVLAPITHDGHGTLLNTNADTIAQETATALARKYEVSLVYGFEKPGVLSRADDDASVICHITRADFDKLKATGTVSGGMIPKIENALRAVEGGVSQVRITLATAINSVAGTVIDNSDNVKKH